MTRENKLALIIGFSLLLVVAVLLADHLSPAQQDRLATLDTRFDAGPAINLPAPGTEGVRQFAAGDQSRVAENNTPTVRLIGPPTPAAQTQQEIDDSLNRSLELDGPGDEARTHFGPDQGEPKGVEPLVMGEPKDSPAPTPSADRRNAEAYTVKDGDTLYGLCKTYYGSGGLYVKLAKFNEGIVPDNGWIREGMTIWIPSRSVLDGKADASSTPARTPSTTPAKTSVKTVNYTIQENDRLWDIAKDHMGKGGRWQEIVDLNKDVIKNPDVLPVGKTIRLPVK